MSETTPDQTTDTALDGPIEHPNWCENAQWDDQPRTAEDDSTHRGHLRTVDVSDTDDALVSIQLTHPFEPTRAHLGSVHLTDYVTTIEVTVQPRESQGHAVVNLSIPEAERLVTALQKVMRSVDLDEWVRSQDSVAVAK
jgi:hypothetical protein